MEDRPDLSRKRAMCMGILHGRTRECALLDELVVAVRNGKSRSLVLTGCPGIGKTALLEYLAAAGSDLAVLRVAGQAPEKDLSYAGLHQLCAPLLDRLNRLPP